MGPKKFEVCPPWDANKNRGLQIPSVALVSFRGLTGGPFAEIRHVCLNFKILIIFCPKQASPGRAIEIPKEAEKLPTRLRFETEAAKHAAQEELNKLIQERKQLQADYQEGVDELENKKQGYLQEISWLQRKVEHLQENLKKAKRAGIEKLRAQGQEGAARRAEKKS